MVYSNQVTQESLMGTSYGGEGKDRTHQGWRNPQPLATAGSLGDEGGTQALASKNAVHGWGCVEGFEADEGTVWFILQSYHSGIMVQMGMNPAENRFEA